MVEQGDILKVNGIKNSVLVVSKNAINESGCVIVCPIVSGVAHSTLAYPIDADRYVLCDNPRRLDIESRGYSYDGRVSMAQLINILDRVQSIFDYY